MVDSASAVQVGSLVPAESAELHVVDAVHTRMGASDNLAMGSSIFPDVAPIMGSFISFCHVEVPAAKICSSHIKLLRSL